MIIKRIIIALLMLVSMAFPMVKAEETPQPGAAETEDCEEIAEDTENPEETELYEEAEETAEEEMESENNPPEEDFSEDSLTEVRRSEEDTTESAELIDLHETTAHAAARILREENQEDTPGRKTDSGMLISKGKIASFDSVINEGSVEFIKLYFINDRPVYCVEPDVNLRLINGQGGVYQGASWDSLDADRRTLLRRIAYFGYGFPATGTDTVAYAATQALVWKVVSKPEQWKKIHDSLRMCDGVQTSFSACTLDRKELDERMEKILYYVEHYDTVPSFAKSDHSVEKTVLKWDETLDLEDTSGVLSWFEEDSEESHQGIEIRTEGNHLLVKISDLYYEGNDLENGKVLTFRRKKEDWENVKNGLLLYEQGEQQKLMAATGEDPVPMYQMAFKLACGEIEIIKTDEYGVPVTGTDTAFLLGWKKGENDGIDEKGNLLWPLMEENGTDVRLFRTDERGHLVISGFLPASCELWLREVECGSLYELNQDPWTVMTGSEGEREKYQFANRLRSVTLEIRKQDAQEENTMLNDAGFVIYEEAEENDLSKTPAPYGISSALPEETPVLTWKQLTENSTPLPKERFVLGEYEYEITEVRKDSCTLSARRTKPEEAEDPPLSRYQLPENFAEGTSFDCRETVHLHAGFDGAGSEVRVHPMKVEESLIREEGAVVFVRDEETGRIYEIDLQEEKPVYDDLPDARSLRINDSFELSYPWLESDGTLTTKTARFTVCLTGPHAMKIQTDSGEYWIDAPDWIGYEDLPEKGISKQRFRVLKEEAAELEVKDDRGNLYSLRSEGTEILKNSSGNAFVSDISYADFDPEKTETGTSLTKEIAVSEAIEYEGPQYADLSGEERQKPAGEFILRKENAYEVKENDGISMTLSGIVNGKEYLVQLTDTKAEKAFFTERVPVTFTVVNKKDPELILFPEGSGAELTEEETAQVLTAEEEHDLQQKDSFEVNGMVYFVEQRTEEETVLCYPWDMDAPLSAEEICLGFLEKEGIQYSKRMETRGTVLLCLLQEEENGRIFTYVSEPILKPEENQEREAVTISVKKPGAILFDELQSARYGEKSENQHITVNGITYRITEVNHTESGVTYQIQDESGAVYMIPDEDGLELPVTIETIMNTPCDLLEKDELELRGERMRILYAQSEPGYGMTVRLKRLRDGKVFEVRETPDPGNRETETILFFKTGKAASLPSCKEECTWRLRTDNPHIQLSRAGKSWMVLSDANTSAVLECTEEESGAVSVRRAVFSSLREEGQTEALPVFAGKSGHQYLRVVDENRHGMPAAGVKVTLYADSDRKEEVFCDMTDRYGSVDLSSLLPGTYWYRDPVTLEEKSIGVLSEENARGILTVSGLSVGRKYLVLEETLPEGYDYQDSEAVSDFCAGGEERTEKVRITIRNELRRMMIQVLKQDQDDNRTPLDNAWFTAEDITGQKDQAKINPSEEVSLSDIPPGSASGEIFCVWPERNEENRRFWRIEKTEADAITLSLLENGKFEKTFRVLKSGYESGAPMLYTDILRCLSNPKEGAVFETGWKEDPSSMRFYRILSVECEMERDVFGELAGGVRIRKAIVEDCSDPGHTPIILEDQDERKSADTELIGEFISGGIIVRKEETAMDAPVSIEELRQMNAENPGDVILAEVRKDAEMPDYGKVQKAWDSGKRDLVFDRIAWEISKPEEGSFLISARGQSFLLYEQTKPGAVSWKEDALLRICSIEKENGRIVSAVIEEEGGNSWLLQEGVSGHPVRKGKAGVEVTIKERGTSLVLHGYTGKDGRLVFADLPEGDYDIESEGIQTFTRVEKGKIFLPYVPYGHLIRICETKSPLGYLKGNACAVIQPKAEIGVDTVTNTRTNRRIVTREEEIRKIVKKRKMGEES